MPVKLFGLIYQEIIEKENLLENIILGIKGELLEVQSLRAKQTQPASTA